MSPHTDQHPGSFLVSLDSEIVSKPVDHAIPRQRMAEIPSCAYFTTDPSYYPSVSLGEKFLSQHADDVERFKNSVFELGEKEIDLE